MHREVSHLDARFRQESHVGLYFLTGLIGLLIGLDVIWPTLAGWLGPLLGVKLPTLPKEIALFGKAFPFAFIPALLGGARVLRGSLDSLLAGRLGADLALAVAVVAAIFINQPLVAAEVVFIGLVGECLEAFTYARTQRALRRLVEVCPRRAIVFRDGQEIVVPVEDLRVNERVLVRPGKRVPVDGVVAEGHSAVDQSTLTGESLPVEKTAGSEVLAGTLNQHGALIVEVRRVAEHTIMGQVLELTARALKEKANVERTADRLARYFLPAVLAIALVTFLVNLWWFRATAGAFYQAAFPALAVLVVACPCALILATPAAIVAALGRLAGTGVLIKGGAALERLAAVNAFAFDKTGTLTQGRLRLCDTTPLGDTKVDEVLRLAATAEQRSEHLLAQLIVSEARSRGLELPAVDEFQAHPGGGVTARVNQTTLLVGNRRFLESQGVHIPPEIDALLTTRDAAAHTSLLVARDGQVIGLIGATDLVRPEASALVQDLRDCGVQRIALLTGDRRAAALPIAEQLEISEVHAELLPAQKAEFIERWKAEGLKVAMVGDGINDAPALARADVGLALGGVGADLAAEAGDVVLMGDPLQPLPLLVRLSRKTVEIIRQNILWFAFGVNAVGIVLTAWVLPAWSEQAREQSPIWAAIYHQLGSLAVLLNAMRLLWFERGRDSAALRRLREGSERFDRWLERLSFHDFFHWAEAHRRKLLAGVAGLVVLLYVGSGVTIIEPDEIGIVQRCGQVLPDDLAPGLHVRWPWPWERVVRAQPDRVRSVEVGFQFSGQPVGAYTWSAAHGDGILRQPEEALMITGDGNLVEVQASLFFTIPQPRRFLFETRDPQETLRALAESVLREVIAERSFLSILSTEREALQRDVAARLRARLALPEYDLGVELHSLAFQDLHPPQELVDAYYEVTRALTQKDREITTGRSDKEQNVSVEQQAKQRTTAQGRAKAHELTTLAGAEGDAFRALALVPHLDSLCGFVLPSPCPGQPWPSLAMLSATVACQSDVELARQLVEFRLHIEAAEQVLAGRAKVLRDPKIKGQLHIMPELLKLRLPPLGRDRELPARREREDKEP